MIFLTATPRRLIDLNDGWLGCAYCPLAMAWDGATISGDSSGSAAINAELMVSFAFQIFMT